MVHVLKKKHLDLQKSNNMSSIFENLPFNRPKNPSISSREHFDHPHSTDPQKSDPTLSPLCSLARGASLSKADGVTSLVSPWWVWPPWTWRTTGTRQRREWSDGCFKEPEIRRWKIPSKIPSFRYKSYGKSIWDFSHHLFFSWLIYMLTYTIAMLDNHRDHVIPT